MSSRPSKPGGRSPTCEVDGDAGAVLPEDVEAPARSTAPGGRARRRSSCRAGSTPTTSRSTRAAGARPGGPSCGARRRESRASACRSRRSTALSGSSAASVGPPGRVIALWAKTSSFAFSGHAFGFRRLRSRRQSTSRQKRTGASDSSLLGMPYGRSARADDLGRRSADLDPVVERVQELPVARRARRVPVLELRRESKREVRLRPRLEVGDPRKRPSATARRERPRVTGGERGREGAEGRRVRLPGAGGRVPGAVRALRPGRRVGDAITTSSPRAVASATEASRVANL